MKHLKFAIPVLLIVIGLSFKKEPVKTYDVKLTLEQWQFYVNALEHTKAALKRSDLPSKDVVFINDSLLTTMQATFSQQISKQLNDEKATPKKDSTKPKK